MLKGPIKTNKNQSRTKKTLGKPKKPNISRSGDIGAGWLGWPGLVGWLAELGWLAGWLEAPFLSYSTAKSMKSSQNAERSNKNK